MPEKLPQPSRVQGGVDENMVVERMKLRDFMRLLQAAPRRAANENRFDAAVNADDPEPQ